MQALLRLSIVDPIVQVELPEQMPHLEFIPTIPLPQEITLNATANFNTLEVAKIGYKVNESKVDTYNGEHGTSYRLLPEQYYEIREDSFDAETLEIRRRKAVPAQNRRKIPKQALLSRCRRLQSRRRALIRHMAGARASICMNR